MIPEDARGKEVCSKGLTRLIVTWQCLFHCP